MQTTNIAAAEVAELKKELQNLAGDDRIARLDLKTIATNERRALKQLARLERDLQREQKNIDRRRLSLAREVARERKRIQRRREKIANRAAIVEGRLA